MNIKDTLLVCVCDYTVTKVRLVISYIKLQLSANITFQEQTKFKAKQDFQHLMTKELSYPTVFEVTLYLKGKQLKFAIYYGMYYDLIKQQLM